MTANEQVVNPDRYKLIPRTLTFITRNDQILLLRGAADKRLWANKYNGVGGHVENDEDVLGSARRELEEETGLNPEDLWLCGVVTVNTNSDTGICVFVFRGEISHEEPKDSSEGKLEWVKEDDYHNLPLVEDLYILLPRILAMRKWSPVFFAHSRYDANGKIVLTFSE